MVPNVGPGQQAAVQIVAWYGDYATWEEALSMPGGYRYKVGVSTPFSLVIPPDGSPAKLWGLRSFEFEGVLEPSTSGLAGLSVAILWLRRFHGKTR